MASDRLMDSPSARSNSVGLGALAALRDESVLARAALFLIVVHLANDAFIQTEPGVDPGDHLLSGIVTSGTLALFALAYPSLRSRLRAWLCLGVGAIGVGAGIAVPAEHAMTEGPSGDDFTGLLATIASLALLVLGFVRLWQTRRMDEPRPRRYARRALVVVGAFLVADLLVFPVVLGYRTTHVPRESGQLGSIAPGQDAVRFKTGDGLWLSGWYLPSQNRAAVIMFPGRSKIVLAHMLAKHGYGVLALDPRGYGDSEGDANALGWGGHEDILAAVRYLQTRPDVDPERIGGIGLSLGGELLIEAAAHTDELRAVVSEGAGVRSYREQLERNGFDRVTCVLSWAPFSASVAIFGNQLPPESLADLVADVASTPLLLIYATNGQGGEDLNPIYFAAAGEPKELWEIPDATHTGGITAHPEEYEQRVITFFDTALLA